LIFCMTGASFAFQNVDLKVKKLNKIVNSIVFSL
jgi:hypothetical protein